MQTSPKRVGLLIAGVWLVFILAIVVVLIALALFSYRRYGGIEPAYLTLSSGYWSSFTQTAGAPAQMTQQVHYNLTSTAGVPASMTADVFYRQTATAGVPASMTADVVYRQTATMGAAPSMTAQAMWEQTATAVATQGAAP